MKTNERAATVAPDTAPDYAYGQAAAQTAAQAAAQTAAGPATVIAPIEAFRLAAMTGPGAGAGRDEPWTDLPRRLYRFRRVRDRIFDADALFGEPAWDMMLDLFVAFGEGKTVSVTSLCIASCVPQTTAMRTIQLLEIRGLVERAADAHDRRRTLLHLSERGLAQMSAVLSTLQQQGR